MDIQQNMLCTRHKRLNGTYNNGFIHTTTRIACTKRGINCSVTNGCAVFSLLLCETSNVKSSKEITVCVHLTNLREDTNLCLWHGLFFSNYGHILSKDTPSFISLLLIWIKRERERIMS